MEFNEKDIDISDDTPRTIKCIRLKGVYGGLDGFGKLEVGKEYHLTDLVVHSWHTEIFLEEFPDLLIGFNSVLFEEV